MAKMVFLCTQMEAGGVQTRAHQMKKKLSAKGHSVKLVFLYEKRPAFEKDADTVILLEKGKKRGIFDLLKAFWNLYGLVRGFRPDGVVGFAHYSSPIATFVGALAGVRVRMATQTNPPGKAPRLARMLDIICGVLPVYTHNVTNSNFITREFDRYPAAYKAKIIKIYNGVGRPQSTLSKEEARERFELPKDVCLLVSTGRLSRQKNHGFLLSILPRLPDVHLAIAGDGELRQELLDQIEALGIADRVHLIGEIPGQTIPDFLASGDIFAFPSKYEAFGLALVEAMAAGLPVITSDIEVLREVVGDAGIHADLDVPETWVDAVHLAREDEYRERAIRLGTKRAQLYSLDAMCDQFEKVLTGNKL